MARPIKDNADYFTHDADMRNDPKIKALRRKFKCEGYGIWNMLLEAITDSDNFRLTVNYEIIAGDFDTDPDYLKDIIDYCVGLGLFQFDVDNSILWSKTLDKRFEPLLSKRKRDRPGIIDSDNTQSKVKHSKVKKSIFTQAPITEVKAGIDDWVSWGDLILKNNDQYWEQMKGRKVTQKELDYFYSVATRNDWTMNDQKSFRRTLLGFRMNGTEKPDYRFDENGKTKLNQ